MQRILFFFSFLMFALLVRANDPTNGNYISLKNAYNFNLPVLDLSLKLPAAVGFRVPFWDKENAFLDIKQQNANYYFNSEAISHGNCAFSFSLPKQNMAAFSLILTNGVIKERLKKIKNSSSYISDLPPLKGGQGIYDGFLMEKNSRKFRIYVLQKDALLITFIVYAKENKEIKQCEKMIQSLHTADLKTEREKYFLMIKNGYFEKKEETDSNVFISDTTHVETTFSFPAFGLNMLFPKDWIYSFYGKKEILTQNTNSLEIHWKINDLIPTGNLFFRIYNKDVNIFARLYPKTDKSDSEMNSLVNTQKTIATFPAIIDGIEAEATATGSPSMPTVYFRLMLNSYILHLTVTNVTTDNAPIVQSIISNIRISEEQKKNIPSAAPDIKPLSEQLNIQEFKPEKLSVIELEQAEPKIAVTKIPVFFKDAGISFVMPKGTSMFCMPEENCIKDDKSIVIKGNPNSMQGNLGITSLGKEEDGMISVSLSSFMDSVPDFDNYFEKMVSDWKTYNMINVKKNVFTIVNGQKWGIMEYVQSKKSVL